MARGWTYDVFISFRGEDTRSSFVDHLYNNLELSGISAFKDDVTLRIGESISPALRKAIKESRFAVIVFSENYANSPWCLEELAEIMECHDPTEETVLPVFYHVDPSDVRKQKGKFATDFQEHEENFEGEMDKVNKWRKALNAAGNLSGHHISNTIKQGEAATVNRIVLQIFGHIPPCGMEENLIGMESRISKLDLLLGIEETKEVRVVGICGMGGIGKTTIAKALLGRIYSKFDGHSFVKFVREKCSSEIDICNLQERIIRDILLVHFRIWDRDKGASLISRKLLNKKVLLILDDVDADSQKQLEFIAKPAWFGLGSRIIIITRDERVVLSTRYIYKPSNLLENQAIELFSRYAFLQHSPPNGYKELSNRALCHTGNLPLALKILGSYFRGLKTHEWESALEKLNTQYQSIFEKLKLSFDGLDSEEKNIFLDIACFFKGKDEQRVTTVLDSFGFNAVIGIKVLIERSLLTISNKRLAMHDVIQEMGWRIVHESLPISRLWKLEDIRPFMKKERELKRIEAIVVPQFNVQQRLGFSANAFRAMEKFRLLDVNWKFTSLEPVFLPNELRWLCWNRYPFSSLPLVDCCELVGLEMRGGSIENLWTGQKIMTNLKFIHLQELEFLKSFPDVSEAPNIKSLVLANCMNLEEVHESLGSHKSLTYVDMSDCCKLKCLPSKIEMKSLETLILSRCMSLEQFPEVMPCMVNLSDIYLDGCGKIEELSSSFRYLCSLTFLNLTSCMRLKNIPNFICELKHLKSLHLHDCVKLLKLPTEIGRMEKLEELFLGLTDSNTTVERLPESINYHILTNLCPLRKLDLSWRQIKDKDFPENFHALFLLEELNLSGNSALTELPASIYHLCHLKHLELNECYRLQNLRSLPSGIQVLRASDCSSLEKIEDLPEKYKWLYKIWLVGCSKLPDQEDETNPSKMLQISFLEKCVAVGHRLSIAIPGSKIPAPRWFSLKNGCVITLELPPGSSSKIMGFAISGVFSRMWNMKDDYPVIKFMFGNFVPERELQYITNVSEIAMTTLWIGYIPFCSFQRMCDDWSGMEGKLTIRIRLQTGQLPVECGARIVLESDVRSNPQINISDYCNFERVTREGSSFTYVDKCRNT